ncbi:MAG: TolB-like translocation protein, partial [Planctomycetota bacterium]
MCYKGKRISRRQFMKIGAQAASGLVVACTGCATWRRAATSASCAVYVERQATGSEIWQITSEQFSQSNIYCELPYCSADGRHFVYERHNPDLTGENRTELMIVEIGTWRQHRLDVTSGLAGCAISADGIFYYLKRTEGKTLELMRADLSTGVTERVYQRKDERNLTSLGTVSTDGRYYVCGKRVADDYTLFGIMLVDIEKGTETIIDRDPFIFNPHPQFEPAVGRELMIQHNRGGQYSPEGKRIRLVGPEGATLYLLPIRGGLRTELQVGKPHTTAATGHETWIGRTGEILLTVMAEDDYAPDKGNLIAVRAGSPARIVAKGYKFNHLGVSRCGRFFCCDDWQGSAKIVIGSIRTGKTAVVCESKASMGRPQNTHPHAYLTPDLKWVIFNSDRS